ncbi:hypothetical protein JCGZ_08046 [Jatropha curcas]|uniref:Uncharacterized protein n=1 Tax=Jatropha curcas TaxID=180498 RepID=A0A067KWY4_JATCU|nr:hypothetical protein JCGZ_08046 [Jatropha curcas]
MVVIGKHELRSNVSGQADKLQSIPCGFTDVLANSLVLQIDCLILTFTFLPPLDR